RSFLRHLPGDDAKHIGLCLLVPAGVSLVLLPHLPQAEHRDRQPVPQLRAGLLVPDDLPELQGHRREQAVRRRLELAGPGVGPLPLVPQLPQELSLVRDLLLVLAQLFLQALDLVYVAHINPSSRSISAGRQPWSTPATRRARRSIGLCTP